MRLISVFKRKAQDIHPDLRGLESAVGDVCKERVGGRGVERSGRLAGDVEVCHVRWSSLVCELGHRIDG